MAFDDQSDVSDEALLRAYGRGDRVAARVLTERHAQRIWRHARHVLRDAAEADDVAQEAMLRLWKIAPEWRAGEAKVSTWLFQVTRNLCTDRLRKRRDVGLDAVAEQPSGDADVVTNLEQSARLTALNRALDELPERQRQAIVLRHLDGLSNPEVGEAMGISVEAVESLTSRARRMLRETLGKRKAELGFGNV